MSTTPQTDQWKLVDGCMGQPSALEAHEVDTLANETYLAQLGAVAVANAPVGNHQGRLMLVSITDSTIEDGDILVVNRSDYSAAKVDGVTTGDYGVAVAGPTASSVAGGATEWYTWIVVEGVTVAKMDAAVTAGIQLYSDAAGTGEAYSAAGLILDGMKSVTAVAAADTTGTVTRDYVSGEGVVSLNRRDLI